MVTDMSVVSGGDQEDVFPNGVNKVWSFVYSREAKNVPRSRAYSKGSILNTLANQEALGRSSASSKLGRFLTLPALREINCERVYPWLTVTASCER